MSIKPISLFLFFTFSMILNGQEVVLEELYELPTLVKETSGLIYIGARLFTHNDSGDGANLYELDATTGEVIRTINVLNAGNDDWEDITQDETHIYIGDIGNNSGDRTNLKIYKITKAQLLTTDDVLASVINYSYEDQADFTTNHHETNFDAEAITVSGDYIYIFTKNWLDYYTNVYSIPNTNGTQIATKISSYNINGLVTGATIIGDNGDLFLCGYNGQLNPFLIQLSNFEDDDFFGGQVYYISLFSEIGIGSQVEAVCYDGNENFYLSRENFETSLAGQDFVYTQKMYTFKKKQ